MNRLPYKEPLWERGQLPDPNNLDLRRVLQHRVVRGLHLREVLENAFLVVNGDTFPGKRIAQRPPQKVITASLADTYCLLKHIQFLNRPNDNNPQPGESWGILLREESAHFCCLYLAALHLHLDAELEPPDVPRLTFGLPRGAHKKLTMIAEHCFNVRRPPVAMRFAEDGWVRPLVAPTRPHSSTV